MALKKPPPEPPAAFEFDYDKFATAIASAFASIASAESEPIPQKIDENEEDCGCDETKDSDGEPQHKGEALGDLIRELRNERELSNEELADAAGVSVAMIGQMIAGTVDCPPAARLQRLARRLNVNLSRLVTAAESDGCDNYDDADAEEASLDAPTQAKGNEDAEQVEADVKAPDAEPSIQHQIDAILTGLPGLPADEDPGKAAYDRYRLLVSSIERGDP